MKYFKVIRGFGQDDYIPIDERELPKAIYAHISGKTVVLENGSINGTHISAIMPDWNRAMGWNPGYKPTAEEHGEIQRGVGKQYHGYIATVKDELQRFLASGETDLNKFSLPEAKKVFTRGLQSLGEIIARKT